MQQDPLYQALDKSIQQRQSGEMDYMRERIGRQQKQAEFQRAEMGAGVAAMRSQIERQKRAIQEQARANKRKKRAGFLGAVGGIIGGAAGFAIGGPTGAAAGYGAGQAIGGGMA